MEERRNAYNISVGTPEGKRPIGRPRHRWENNIRMDVREIMWTDIIGLRIGTSGGLL
jgi:hypothetical protein